MIPFVKLPFFLFLIVWSVQTFAQKSNHDTPQKDVGISTYHDVDSAIIDQFSVVLTDLEKALEKKDPYGFLLSIQVSHQELDKTSNKLYNLDNVFEDLHYQSTLFTSKERFFKYNFNQDIKEIKQEGQYIYAAGLMAELVTNNTTGHMVHARTYSYKHSVDGKTEQYVIRISAMALVEKPANGSIVTDIFFYDEEGVERLWDQSWQSKKPEVSYIRSGPGSEKSNSGKNPDRKGTPDHNGQLVVQGQYSPGYYMPIVEFRGCRQDFSTYDKYKDFSVVLSLEKAGIQWNRLTVFADGTTIPESSLKTETMKAGDLKTNFSKGNIIRGTIYDSKTGGPLEKSIRVILKPEFSPAKYNTLSIESKSDGTYEFTDIESGIYLIYPEGNAGKGQKAAICNCPQKGEGANHTYTVDLLYQETLYTITAEYKNRDLFDAKVMWENVSMGFPDDIHEDPPMVQIPPHGALVDISTLKPPFTVALPPYGKFSFYSNIPEANEECVVISKKINNPIMNECIIDGGSFAIKRSKTESPHIFLFLNFDVEMTSDEESAFLLIPVAVGALEDESPSTFEWNQLDESIIEKIKNGQPATKSLTNAEGSTIIIEFKPQN